MGHADVADHRSGPRDRECGGHRLAGADALKRGVDADAVGELHDGVRGLVAAVLDDIGGAEVARKPLPVGVAAQRDDALGAQPLGREDAGEADGAVADDGDRAPGTHVGADSRVVAG